MSKKVIQYTVRGFNVISERFTEPTGVIEQFNSFKEIVVNKQHEAVTAILADEDIHTMTVPHYLSLSNVSAVDKIIGCDESGADNHKNMIYVVDLKIYIGTSNKLEIKNMKSTLREDIKRWAEKSRIKNLRGWRASAIKSPSFEYLFDETIVTVQVILSNAVIYSDSACTISPIDYSTAMEDLQKLYKRLKKDLPIKELRYHHSLFGSGEVI